jgi:hypothetical protein
MEINSDVTFQRREWTAQRVGWIVIAGVILAALAGTFGTGPVSRASAQAPGLQLEYERFVRLRQPMRLRCLVLETKPETQIAVSREYVDSVQIEQITPPPIQAEAAGTWLVYRFAGPAPMAVTFTVKAEEFGYLTGAVRIPDAEAVSFHQFIYP